MSRKILFLFVFLLLITGGLAVKYARDVFACGGSCPNGLSDCAGCCAGVVGSCSYSCITRNVYPYDQRCVVTQTSTGCGNWCGWSGCSGGFQTRDCCDGTNNDYQIRACSSPTSGGGGGCNTNPWVDGACGGGTCTSDQRQQTRTVSPAGCAATSRCIADASCVPVTPPPGCTTTAWVSGSCGGGTCTLDQRQQTRTVSPAGCDITSRCIADSACTVTGPPPSCTVSSAVLSPSSASVTVGTSRTFSLTATDNPVGCTEDAYYVVSNGNVSITSPNPDSAQPFTVNVYCNNAGTAVLTGQANVGGTARASDTSAITCTALPTSPPTITAAPGQCGGATFSGSGTCSGTNLNLSYSWGAVSGASTYRTQVSSSPTFGTLLVNTTGFSTSYSVTEVGGTYYARTRVETSTGSCAAPSNWSNVVTISNICGGFTSPTPTPTGVPSATPTNVPPAQITLTPVVLNGVGDTGTGFVTISPPGASLVGPVNFVISGTPGVATVSSPDSPSGAPYTTTATSLSIGTTTYTVVATDNNGNVVTATGTIEVKNPKPWCQAKEGDVIAGRVNPLGNVYCPIPNVCTLNPACDPSIITFDPAEAPGVVIAGGGVNPGSGQSSQSPYNFTVTGDKYDGPTYDYAYFDSKAGSVPFNSVGANPVSSAAQLTGAPLYSGYKWYKYSGNLTIGTGPAIDLGSNRVVLFVNGNLTINSKINVNNGSGFFMVVVNGDITVSPTVHDANAFGAAPDTNPELEGLYFATGNFKTGTAGTNPDGTGNDQQLHVRGSVAVSNFTLERNLPDNSGISSELFEYGPDQVMLMPSILSRKQVIWREVAP